ncbi:MAG: protein TonB, partial [Roseivirga sp.]
GKVADTRGNMGDPTGKATANGSKAGGADPGVSLSLEGWKWQAPPAEKDESQIDGIIKFSIEVDDRGTVINVTKIPGTTISDNTVIEFYKKQVEKLLFTQTDPSKAVAMTSRGEITFVIKTN